MSSNLLQVKSLVSEDHPPTHGTLIDGYGKEFEVPTYTIKDIRGAIPLNVTIAVRSGASGIFCEVSVF
jgi:hypothetical protein